MIINESYMKYVCDCCEHTCWFLSNTNPKGWGTMTEDHSDSYCPDCNPWLVYSKEPDKNKLDRIVVPRFTDE